MGLVAQGLRDCMHAIAPKCADMWAQPTYGPMQGWNENGHKTDVASRPGSVFTILDLENPRKCVERRKNTGVGVGAVDGDGNLWKKCREV